MDEKVYYLTKDSAFDLKCELIKVRNYFIDKPFSIHRKKIMKQVGHIDVVIDFLEMVEFKLKK